MKPSLTTAIPPRVIESRPDTALEWWFVQGRFWSEGGGEHDFVDDDTPF